MNTMYTALVVDLEQVHGAALYDLLMAEARRAARCQYGCEVMGETERSERDYWAVPGDLQGRQVVVSRWEVRRLPASAPKPGEVVAWMRGTVFIGGVEVAA